MEYFSSNEKYVRELWLEQQLASYFENADEVHTFLFGNCINCLQSNNEERLP
ncbi:MAG TPA: hypothetical protein VG367_00405 [Mucilaginibacter sp.]|nr:hypothetical protein [Mucilaginibacter sp.]